MTVRRVKFFDTTLRDGEQAPGNAMDPAAKLQLALAIESLGVDRIETGFPASSASDYEATRLISRHLVDATFASFCRAVPSDITVAVSAGGTARHQIQIAATGSDIHLEHKRRISRAEGVHEVIRCIKHGRSLGITDISVGIEDASRGPDSLLRELAERSVDAGAQTLVVADTAGALLPVEYGQLIARFRSWVPESVMISTHCHEDLGLSTANALAGIMAGADEVQVTLGGVGERAGNTALEEIAALLAYKQDATGLYTDLNLEGMYEVYTLLRHLISLDEPRNKAIFGTYAFSTAAGMHQQGMLRNPATYEFVQPSQFGRERGMFIGRHSGTSVLRHLLSELHIEVDDHTLQDLYHTHILDRKGDCEDLSVVKARLASEFGSAASISTSTTQSGTQ
ncbi:pyruvate carboxyltransferase [Rathayibacter rathayi]|uniref:2-isopropylmalate synthase n=1 Tax=Rathayibacter rathayi TaxID=33887 RepID=A0ABD6W7V6_RATRA|nr:pyruvate carboxyltransferase [Rathayibacter rathayi]MWV75575.1 pyruvate carboxyltransferase [Rathayibacter rathayi NCPPB 2980 = VKM Ac-1601]PPF13301.1 pyruvate carboxyltransferase [Rathayibacter rathayi]PPF49133.1 pyruvate carboxyltransferase [Rathayibacter rathayi]PPG67718.1 pyruvate carboxyltransferase [Rathayibacter rathayi]